jgi:hypothetical protein
MESVPKEEGAGEQFARIEIGHVRESASPRLACGLATAGNGW